MRGLNECALSEKILYTSFLVVIGVGYLMAMVYLYTSHSGHDGRAGLSVNDIVENYYGNRSGTRLEAAIRGPMSGYIETQERHHIVAWLKSGAPEDDYESVVAPILQSNCIACHTPASGLDVPDLSNYSGVKSVSEIDTGVSLHSLMRLSHIHLFGIGLILFGLGIVFVRTQLPFLFKTALIVTPFASIIADILAWFLTKWDPFYATTVVFSGALLGVSIAGQIFLSLWQIWFFGIFRKEPI